LGVEMCADIEHVLLRDNNTVKYLREAI